MSDFEYFFTFFGLLLGLTMTEVASKFADAIENRAKRPMGLLTPLLACFVLLDVASLWLWIWSGRSSITIRWDTVFAALAIAITYYLCAALVFPRHSTVRTLDEHYWEYKRYILSGILAVQTVILGVGLFQQLPHSGDFWFFAWQIAYYAPLLVVLASRSRRLDIAMLSLAVFLYALNFSSVLPSSQWAKNIGIDGTASPK